MMIWVYRLYGVRTRAKKNNGIPKDLEISYGGKIRNNVIFKVVKSVKLGNARRHLYNYS